MDFVGSGRDVLKAAFELKGVEAWVNIKIEFACADGDSYDTLFVGRGDFAKYEEKQGLGGCYASVGFQSATCLMKLKTRTDQNVDLDHGKGFDGTDLDGYDALGTTTNLPTKEVLFNSKSSLKTQWAHDFQLPVPMVSGTVTDNNTLMPLMNVDIADLKDFAGGSGTCTNGVANGLDSFEDVLTMNPLVKTLAFNIEGQMYFNGYVRNNSGAGKSSKVTMYVFRSPSWAQVTAAIFAWGGLSAIPNGGGGLTRGRTYCLTKAVNILYPSGTQPLPSAGDTAPFQFFFNHGSFDILTGEKYFVFFDWFVNNAYDATADITIHFDNTCYLRLWQHSAFEATPAKVYFVNEAFARVTEALTDGCMTAKSDYFGRTDSQPYASGTDGCAGGHAISNGLLIRRFVDASGKQPKMVVSLTDLFKGMNALHNIGMGVEADTDRGGGALRMRIEPKKYFYQDTTILTCDNVDNLVVMAVPERYISTVKGGYANWGAPTYNGLDDMHSNREYRTTQDQNRATLDLTCNMVASTYSIELTRREYGRSAADWKYDNNIFVIHHKRDGSNLVVDTDITSQSGTESDVAYNVFITPIRNMMRHIMNIFNTYRDVLGGVLKFTNGTGNYNATINYSHGCDPANGNALIESRDIDYSIFADAVANHPLYRPEQVKFNYPMSYADWQTVQANPYGLVAYSVNGGSLQYGWIEDLKYSPYKGTADFILKPKIDY
jgi:hypothetical protein